MYFLLGSAWKYDLRETPVYQQLRPETIAGVVGSLEQRGFCHFFWSSTPTQGDSLRDHCGDLLRRDTGWTTLARNDRGIGHARAEDVDSNASGKQFSRERARQRAHRCLRGQIHGWTNPPNLVGVTRADQDDRRSIAEMWKRSLHREEDTFKEDVAKLVEQLFRHRFQRSKFCDACVCHQNIDLAKLLGRLIEQNINVIQFPDVSLHGERVVTQSCGGPIKGLTAPAENHNLRAVGFEFLCRCQPDTAISAGNYGHFVLELHKCAHFRSLIMLTEIMLTDFS